MKNDNKVLLDVNMLKKYFPILKGFLRRTVGFVKAVDGVDFSIPEGRTLGLVGESGWAGCEVSEAVSPRLQWGPTAEDRSGKSVGVQS